MSLKICIKVGFALKGGNQKALANHIGKTRGSVSQYISGKIDPPLSVVLSICGYFKVQPSVFFGWGEEE